MIALRYELSVGADEDRRKEFYRRRRRFSGGLVHHHRHLDDRPRAGGDRGLGLTASTLSALPQVPMHDADPPRIAIYSQWTNTQDLGWYRLTFDRFHIPYDLIYKESVKKGNLRADYDVILMAAQQINRQTVLQPAAAKPAPYLKSDKYQFLGMYGETPDMSGGFGQEGVDAFGAFLEAGGTLIAAGPAARFPIDFGWAHTVDTDDGKRSDGAAPDRAGRDHASRSPGLLRLC